MVARIGLAPTPTASRFLNRIFASFFAYRIAALRLCVIIVLSAAGGCATYKTTDHDQGVSQLIGLRCQVVTADKFREGRPLWFPTLAEPFYGDDSNFVELTPGTILRVSHVQSWEHTYGVSGTIVFAIAENGPMRGHSFVIGYYGTSGDGAELAPFYNYKEGGGEPAKIDVPLSLAPFGPIDEGWFYGDDPNEGPPGIAEPKHGVWGGGYDKEFIADHLSFIDRGKAGSIGVLFLGDDMVEGWRNKGPADIFAAHYGKYDPANFGISGDKTQNVLWRIENGEFDGIHPRVIVLLIGTNHLLSRSVWLFDGIKKIIDEIHEKLPESKLIIMGIFPRGDDSSNGLLDPRYPNGHHVVDGRAMFQAVNAQLAKLDDGGKTRYLDIWDKLLDSNGMLTTDIMADYLHPTTKGYEIWADAMQPMLDQMMAPWPATATTTAPAN